MCYSSIKIVFVFQNNTLSSFLLTVQGNILLQDNLVPKKGLHSIRLENGEVLEAGSNTEEGSRFAL